PAIDRWMPEGKLAPQPCFLDTAPQESEDTTAWAYSCWGTREVNAADEIFVMKGVTPTACAGSLEWEQISGSLNVIEVSTDGKVFGVNADGDVYQRHVQVFIPMPNSTPSSSKDVVK
ncbi:hypothetical protein NFI96_025677, partial [Prochilodus magdalenae]